MPANASSKHAATLERVGLRALIVLLPAALVVCCTSPAGPEAPATEVTAAAQDADAPSSCKTCHPGVTDPHPGANESACVVCHGGDASAADKERAHRARPRHPERWQGGRNPKRSYTLLNDEDPEWIRFVNPGDLRVADETCGRCHADEVLNVQKSLMTTAGHFWGAAAYCNGIVPEKRTLFGESYARDGTPQRVNNLLRDGSGWRPPTAAEITARSYAPVALPLPHWEVTQPGNVYRVFERGSRLGGVALGFNGAPSPLVGLPDKLEDPGRPNNRLSDRGLGTLNRVDLPLLNVHKTRLNDPMLSFMGTNDQPGDYRSSGCTACHMVYANDRSPVHSGPWARYGHLGAAHGSSDPFLAALSRKPADDAVLGIEADGTQVGKEGAGHPIQHRFTTAIPSSQCMVCHMHQPNSFLNTFYGFQMWAYETDGQPMWEPAEADPSHAERFTRQERNPEAAAQTGKWGDPDFLQNVADLNPQLKHTQFADYHGHGWVFRAVFKMDRKGNLLDKDGKVVPYDDPRKFEGVLPPLGEVSDQGSWAPQPGKPVHLKDIHLERGMHCVDCHFEQDVHGDGALYAEYQAAIQIQCQDCHGTPEATVLELRDKALKPSGPAAKPGAAPFTAGKVPFYGLDSPDRDARARFYVDADGRTVKQRSMLHPGKTWTVKQVKDTITEGNPDYNARAAYAKCQTSRDGGLAHGVQKMDCAACHTSWVTSCFGCHLPQKANWRTEQHHFEAGKNTRNYATYNPQVARDDAFMLGVMPDVKRLDASTPRIGVVRSSSAVLISSEDSQRRIIYKQQPTIAGNGMSSQAFNTHFAHTVRTTETRACSDCHPSAREDNNAWLAQTYLLGTNYVNFIGLHAFVAEGDAGLEAISVTEWDEPQAVIGSELHRLAYPDRFAAHVARDRTLTTAEHHGGTDVRSLELRGEYLYAACGAGGFRVFDVANVANKDFSEKIVTAPVSPLGQDTHVSLPDATAVALPTNNPISVGRTFRPENAEQNYPYRGRDQYLHESYRYAYVTDRVQGLVLVDVECLADGDPTNNFLTAAVRFDGGGALAGAVNLAVAGTTVYVCCDRGLAVVGIDDPLQPELLTVVEGLDHPRAVAVQFRYAFVVDRAGLAVVSIDERERAALVAGARVELADARDVYVARTYAYVAGGAEGLVIVDVERPRQPRLARTFDAEGRIGDLHQVKVAMTNDSVYAYLADGSRGFHVLSLVTPEDGGRSAYGFAPEPRPKWIATYPTAGPARAIAKGLDRDRAVDESGHQVAVFGRIGGRPLTRTEMQRLYVGDRYPVEDDVPGRWRPSAPDARGGGGR